VHIRSFPSGLGGLVDDLSVAGRFVVVLRPRTVRNAASELPRRLWRNTKIVQAQLQVPARRAAVGAVEPGLEVRDRAMRAASTARRATTPRRNHHPSPRAPRTCRPPFGAATARGRAHFSLTIHDK
jgi:hypothetical protein